MYFLGTIKKRAKYSENTSQPSLVGIVIVHLGTLRHRGWILSTSGAHCSAKVGWLSYTMSLVLRLPHGCIVHQ